MVIDEEEIAEVLAQWTGIPVHRLTQEETARLLEMEVELHKRIIGQNEAIAAVSKAIREVKASKLILIPGAMAPPRYSFFLFTTSNVVAVPRSTIKTSDLAIL